MPIMQIVKDATNGKWHRAEWEKNGCLANLGHQGRTEIIGTPGENTIPDPPLEDMCTRCFPWATERLLKDAQKRVVELEASTAKLHEFCDLIDQTGGLVQDPLESGNWVPVADPEWVDLGIFYVEVCKMLERQLVL